MKVCKLNQKSHDDLKKLKKKGHSMQSIADMTLAVTVPVINGMIKAGTDVNVTSLRDELGL